MPSECPGRPWQKLGADLFLLGRKTYLLVVDYFSRYVEIAGLGLGLSHTRSIDVIVHLKSIFARHGIPEVLMSDTMAEPKGWLGWHWTPLKSDWPPRVPP